VKPIQVLIVDEDPRVRAQLSRLLTLRGCIVQTASNAAKASEFPAGFQPSLVLVDMRLAPLSGTVLGQEANIPVVVMGPEHEAQRCAAEIGAAGFLPKPVQVSRLLACVQIPDRDDSTSAA